MLVDWYSYYRFSPRSGTSTILLLVLVPGICTVEVPGIAQRTVPGTRTRTGSGTVLLLIPYSYRVLVPVRTGTRN